MNAVASDGLEIREWEDGFGIFDTLTEKFVGSKHRRRHWLEITLRERRAEMRPLILRWLYDLPIEESRRLGVPEGR